MSDLVTGDDGKARCRWGSADELYRRYHDSEWGRPVTDERVRVPETQFVLSRRGLVFVNEASERVSSPNSVKSNDGL